MVDTQTKIQTGCRGPGQVRLTRGCIHDSRQRQRPTIHPHWGALDASARPLSAHVPANRSRGERPDQIATSEAPAAALPVARHPARAQRPGPCPAAVAARQVNKGGAELLGALRCLGCLGCLCAQQVPCGAGDDVWEACRSSGRRAVQGAVRAELASKAAKGPVHAHSCKRSLCEPIRAKSWHQECAMLPPGVRHAA